MSNSNIIKETYIVLSRCEKEEHKLEIFFNKDGILWEFDDMSLKLSKKAFKDLLNFIEEHRDKTLCDATRCIEKNRVIYCKEDETKNIVVYLNHEMYFSICNAFVHIINICELLKNVEKY